ncbi:MAG: hypothetical protein ACRES9_02525 [Gammaproteobacteria bacterium]
MGEVEAAVDFARVLAGGGEFTPLGCGVEGVAGILGVAPESWT